jgi:outer membrane immunogenic protein
MRMLSRFALALAFGSAASTAFAADAISYATSDGAVAVPVVDGGFDWSGFYAGVYGAAQFSQDGRARYGAGLDLGLNAQYDFYLLGAEVAAHGLTDGNGDAATTAYGQVLARGGVLVTDDVAVYAAAGYGLDLGPADNSQWLLGGGLEMAVTDNVSLRAQYLHGFTNAGDETTNQVTIGANYHF